MIWYLPFSGIATTADNVGSVPDLRIERSNAIRFCGIISGTSKERQNADGDAYKGIWQC